MENLNRKSKENLKEELKDLVHEFNVVKRCNFGLIMLVFILFIVALIGVICGVTFGIEYYNLLPQIKHSFLSPVSVELVDNQSSLVTVSVLPNTMGNVDYNQLVKLNSSKLTTNQLVRGKVVITKHDGSVIDITLKNTDNWVKGSDGYYYYLGVVNSKSEVEFVDKLTLPTGVSDRFNYITFFVECINDDVGLANLVWKSAPLEWIDTVNNA